MELLSGIVLILVVVGLIILKGRVVGNAFRLPTYKERGDAINKVMDEIVEKNKREGGFFSDRD